MPVEVQKLISTWYIRLVPRHTINVLLSNNDPNWKLDGLTRVVITTHTDGSQEIEKCSYLCNEGYDAENIILHEIGHAVSYEYSLIKENGICASATEEFVNIYNEEVGNVVGVLQANVRNNDEYFAECFRQYFCSPQNLARCPKTISYIQKVLADISKVN